jgi:hypothetical protein
MRVLVTSSDYILPTLLMRAIVVLDQPAFFFWNLWQLRAAVFTLKKFKPKTETIDV